MSDYGVDFSKINLGLTSFPSDDLDPKVYAELMSLQNACKNLARAVSQYCGVDEEQSDNWGQIGPRDTILTQNHVRLYPKASVAITAGQAINLYNGGEADLMARLASANSAATMCHGIAMTSCAAGSRFMMYFLRGFVTTVGGMTQGTVYWLSTVAGGIQNAKPSGAGQIQQPIGIANRSSELIMDVSLMFNQL